MVCMSLIKEYDYLITFDIVLTLASNIAPVNDVVALFLIVVNKP